MIGPRVINPVGVIDSFLTALRTGQNLGAEARETVRALYALPRRAFSMPAGIQGEPERIGDFLVAIRGGRTLEDGERAELLHSLTLVRDELATREREGRRVEISEELVARELQPIIIGPLDFSRRSAFFRDRRALTPPPRPATEDAQVEVFLHRFWEAARSRSGGNLDPYFDQIFTNALTDPHYRTAHVLDTVLLAPPRTSGPEVGTEGWFRDGDCYGLPDLFPRLHQILGCDQGPYSVITSLTPEGVVRLYRSLRTLHRSDSRHRIQTFRLLLREARTVQDLDGIIRFYEDYDALLPSDKVRFLRWRLAGRDWPAGIRTDQWFPGQLNHYVFPHLDEADLPRGEVATLIPRFRSGRTGEGMRARLSALESAAAVNPLVGVALPLLRPVIEAGDSQIPEEVEEVLLALEASQKITVDGRPPSRTIPPERLALLFRDLTLLTRSYGGSRTEHPKDFFWDRSPTSDQSGNRMRGDEVAERVKAATKTLLNAVVALPPLPLSIARERIRQERGLDDPYLAYLLDALEGGEVFLRCRYESLWNPSPISETFYLSSRGGPGEAVLVEVAREGVPPSDAPPPPSLHDSWWTFDQTWRGATRSSHEVQMDTLGLLDRTFDQMPPPARRIIVRTIIASYLDFTDTPFNEPLISFLNRHTRDDDIPRQLIELSHPDTSRRGPPWNDPPLRQAFKLLERLYTDPDGSPRWSEATRTAALAVTARLLASPEAEHSQLARDSLPRLLAVTPEGERRGTIPLLKGEAERSPEAAVQVASGVVEMIGNLPEWWGPEVLSLFPAMGEDRLRHLAQTTEGLPPRHWPLLIRTLHRVFYQDNHHVMGDPSFLFSCLATFLIDHSRTPGEFHQAVNFFTDFDSINDQLQYGFLYQIWQERARETEAKRAAQAKRAAAAGEAPPAKEPVLSEELMRLVPTKAQERLRAFLTDCFVTLLPLERGEGERLHADLKGRARLWNTGNLLPHLASLTSFSTDGGRRSITRLVRAITSGGSVAATTAVGNRRFVNPGRYETMRGSFSDRFIERWGNGDRDFIYHLGELDPAALLSEDPLAVRRYLYEHTRNQIAHHLGIFDASLLPPDEVTRMIQARVQGAAFDRVAGGTAWAERLVQLIDQMARWEEIDKVRVAELIDEANRNPTLTGPLGQGGRETIADLTELKKALGGKVLTGNAWLVITGDPADFIGSGRRPVNCQDPTRNTGYNTNGEQVNRANDGRFRLAKIVIAQSAGLEDGLLWTSSDGKVVAWSELEVTLETGRPDPSARPHLLAEVLYAEGSFLQRAEVADTLNAFAEGELGMDPEREVHIAFTGQGIQGGDGMAYPSPLPDNDSPVYRDTFHQH